MKRFHHLRCWVYEKSDFVDGFVLFFCLEFGILALILSKRDTISDWAETIDS